MVTDVCCVQIGVGMLVIGVNLPCLENKMAGLPFLEVL